MRILIANDGFGDAGGVQTYLDAVAGGLAARGHELALLHRDAAGRPFAGAETLGLVQFSAAAGTDEALAGVRQWRPDLCFSHNMNRLDIDSRLCDEVPVVKFMHGYFGTCISGLKQMRFPAAQPCGRPFGAACLALYGPRHCGQLNVAAFVRNYRWARGQHELLARYHTIVVASNHMKGEYVRNGVPSARVEVNPLFAGGAPTPGAVAHGADTPSGLPDTVAFLGRMTELKGGDLLVEALALASRRVGRQLRLLLIGDGPQRAAWEARAARLGVPTEATGWLSGDERWRRLRAASVLAVPSTWPEPFGLVGLEAAALGIPAVAFDVGGIREWLRPGVNGCLVAADPPRPAALADAIAHVLASPEELGRMGRGALQVAREMSLDRHLDRLEEIFSRVCPSPVAARVRRAAGVRS